MRLGQYVDRADFSVEAIDGFARSKARRKSGHRSARVARDENFLVAGPQTIVPLRRAQLDGPAVEVFLRKESRVRRMPRAHLDRGDRRRVGRYGSANGHLYKNCPPAENPYMDPDQETIDDEVRDGIEKELQRPDLSPEDRAQYEKALERLRKG